MTKKGDIVEIPASQAAKMVTVSVRTIRRWANRALDGDPSSPLRYARVSVAGRYWVSKAEIDAIRTERERRTTNA